MNNNITSEQEMTVSNPKPREAPLVRGFSKIKENKIEK